MKSQDLQQVLPLFLNLSNAAIAVKDMDGGYLFANPEFGRYVDAPLERIWGGRDAEFLDPERLQAFAEAESAAFDAGAAINREEHFPRGASWVSYVSTRFPIIDEQGRAIALGVLAMDISAQHRTLRDTDQALKTAEQVNAQLRQAVATLEELASTDRLTQAWNRRRFDEAVEGEMHRAIRYGHPLSMLLLDIDHFKKVNDNHGHQEGDRVLREVAGRVREVLRKSDSLTRWGGEEFIVLAPNTGLSNAGVLGERIRCKVAGQPVEGLGVVTVSIGVAEYGPADSLAEWMDRADRAMYAAKREGRNRVELDTLSGAQGTAEHLEGAFVQLIWKDAFQSGHPVIDEQHRALFRVCNELLEAMLSARPADEVSMVVEGLLAEVARHFMDEEAVLSKAGFPGLKVHAEAHAALLDKGRALKQAFDGGSLSVGGLFQFLAYDVVARHILGVDRAYFPYVAGV
jgi:diguanylate cyclase (GGDEF)-like protein/hemerythrin-like metal-binding protein